MFKHVNGDFAGDRRVEWQADQRVPHSTGTSRTTSTTTVGYRWSNFSIVRVLFHKNLSGGGHDWRGPIVPSIDYKFPS